MTEATYLDPTGRPAPEPTGGAICAMVAVIGCLLYTSDAADE